MTRRVLAFSSAVEAVTGVAAFAAPGLVGRLLLGQELTGVAAVVVRCFGIALFALSAAVWPGDAEIGMLLRSLRGMAVYNVMIAMYLGYVGAVDRVRGPLLWPAVAIHAVVTVLLIRPHSTGPSTP